MAREDQTIWVKVSGLILDPEPDPINLACTRIALIMVAGIMAIATVAEVIR